ncbi:hypothetical protein TSUD_398430 [Trifolium subterraneum]|uniref:Peptidase C1A papain C-terminal domain-containing protein n=1 Tax=Trifolium subterraneum TaxID=3900 RepID=A0A2Z6ND69_TRISU|nr:hypothetical protein TSUD_398430 [Trifolium subterraneum]
MWSVSYPPSNTKAMESLNEKKILLSCQDVFNHMMKLTKKEKDKAKGASFGATLAWIRENGCILEEDCPYDFDGNVTPFEYERKIQQGPLAAEMLWVKGMEKLTGEVYSGPDDEKYFDKENRHGVVLVGFGETMNNDKLIKFWIIQNSHGDKWGENGFAKIDRAPCHGRLLIYSVWVIRGVTDNMDKKGD